MAVSFRNKEYENERLKRAELGNVQAREILREGRSVGGTDEKLKDALLRDRFIIKVGDQRIGEQSFFMNEFISGRKLTTAENVVSFQKIQQFKDADSEVDLDERYTLINTAFQEEDEEEKDKDKPTVPEVPKSPDKDKDQDKPTVPEAPNSRDEPEPEPSPGIPEGEEPEDSQREMNPLVIYAIVGILAYVTAR